MRNDKEGPAVNLFGPLVDLGQERFKNFLRQTLRRVDCSNLGPELPDSLLLILLVDLLQFELVKNNLDLSLELLVFAAVGSIEDFPLFGTAALESLVDQPRALVVLDVGANLSNKSGITKSI